MIKLSGKSEKHRCNDDIDDDDDVKVVTLIMFVVFEG